MRAILSLAIALALAGQALGQVALPAEYRIKLGRLGKLEAQSKSTVKWINLHDGLDLIADSSGRWAIVLGNTPGKYKVAAYACGEDGPTEPAYCLVVVEGPDPAPGGPKPAPTGADPAKATCKLRFGNSGCTATIIGPRRDDGYWSALTAAHCTGGVGSVGQITLPDARTFPVKVTARDTNADVTWLRIEDASLSALPYAILATTSPAVGTNVWHQGYGVDKPGNRETGKVSAGEDSNGQLQFQLSVSSGDSGSGIFREDNGDLVGVVCCTSARGAKVTMWGGSSIVAAKLKVSDNRDRPIFVFPLDEEEMEAQIPVRSAQLSRGEALFLRRGFSLDFFLCARS